LQEASCTESIHQLVQFNESFAQRLSTLQTNLPIKNVRQLGTILAFEIAQGKDEYLNNMAADITARAMLKGLYIRPLGNTVYIMPPYCIMLQELDWMANCIIEILHEIKTPPAKPVA